MIELSLNILDIVQNSIKAGASRINIALTESKSMDKLVIEIKDNGSGIPEEQLSKVTDPFFSTRKTRSIGMGLPLLKHHANLADGDISVDSHEGNGTTVKASFVLSHIDRQPVGDIAGVMTILMSANPEIEFIYDHKTDNGRYTFSSAEILNYLEIKNFSNNQLLSDIKEMIEENLKDIGVSDIYNAN